jgi:phospholipid/cholesterol/gamma-HCH transport system substrate-binding protein
MSAPVNHWKLGLFVLVGLGAAIGAIAFFGERSFRKETVSYETFFDESVQGLEVGSPVKYRGVTIGSVVDINVAVDRRHVGVTYELGVKVLDALGLAADKLRGQKRRLIIPPDLRAQLASSGLTGVKFIQLDFFNGVTSPPLELPFEIPENHIPAVGSMMKGLEDSVVRAVDGFPLVVAQVLVLMERVGKIIQEIEDQHLPRRVGDTLTLLDVTLRRLDSTLVALEPGKLSKEAQEALASLHSVLAKLDGERGTVASLQRTSDSVGAMAENANGIGPSFEDVARDVQGAARAVQRLADALELDPDMLIKGRGKKAPR